MGGLWPDLRNPLTELEQRKIYALDKGRAIGLVEELCAEAEGRHVEEHT